MQFILETIVTPFVSSLFTIIGGTIPIMLLIFLFSKKEKQRLLLWASERERTLPTQEKAYEKLADLLEKAISPQTFDKSINQFKQLRDFKNEIEDNKRFVKYAKNYNFMSAIGHVLRMGNYMPKGISEHIEISKNLPASSSNDT